jgi:hypothetical protein
MRIRLWLPLCIGLLGTTLHAAAVQFQVTPLGGTSFRYTYFLSGFAFNANQALDIQFAPSLYGTLSNGMVGSGFGLVLLQPNNPPGTAGDYIALAQMSNPPLTGPFSVDFLFKGIGTPGAQPYVVEQFDQNFNIVPCTGPACGSGTTTPVGSTIPEPGSFSLGGVALLISAVWWTGRRQLQRTAQR